MQRSRTGFPLINSGFGIVQRPSAWCGVSSAAEVPELPQQRFPVPLYLS